MRIDYPTKEANSKIVLLILVLEVLILATRETKVETDQGLAVSTTPQFIFLFFFFKKGVFSCTD